MSRASFPKQLILSCVAASFSAAWDELLKLIIRWRDKPLSFGNRKAEAEYSSFLCHGHEGKRNYTNDLLPCIVVGGFDRSENSFLSSGPGRGSYPGPSTVASCT